VLYWGGGGEAMPQGLLTPRLRTTWNPGRFIKEKKSPGGPLYGELSTRSRGERKKLQDLNVDKVQQSPNPVMAHGENQPMRSTIGVLKKNGNGTQLCKSGGAHVPRTTIPGGGLRNENKPD